MESRDWTPGGTVQVAVQREKGCEDLPLPAYQTEGSACMDLYAAVEELATVKPGERRLIPTGLRMAIPEGFEGQVRARSGLAINEAIVLPNAPGTIDSDYRGPVQVILLNLGSKPFSVRRGDRIAQLAICPVARCEWRESSDLPGTDRGDGGFGHTGS